MNDDDNPYFGSAIVIIIVCVIGVFATIGPSISDWILK